MRRYLQLSLRSTRTALYCRSILLVFVRSCSSIKYKIISFKNLFHHSQLGAPRQEKNPGALGTCPVCPLVKTALGIAAYGCATARSCSWPISRHDSPANIDDRHLTATVTTAVPALSALGPWTPPAERGPSLESIYPVSLTVDLCEG